MGGSSAPELGVAAFGSFGCGTEVLLVSLLAGCPLGALSSRGGRQSLPRILCPAASVLEAGRGEPPADQVRPALAVSAT